MVAGFTARARADAPELPPLLFGDESVASTEGARSLLFNPAGVGLRYPSDWVLAYTRGHDGTPLSPGFGVASTPAIESGHGLLTMRNVGLFASYAKSHQQAYGFGLAGGGDGMRFGLTTAWLVSGGDVTADARVGALSRPAPWLSLGGLVEHLFQPSFQGATLGRDYTLALGFRPLALSPAVAHDAGTRLTLTTDLVMAENGDMSQTRVRVGANVEPIPGLLLRGTVEDHGGFHIGIGIGGVRATANLRSGYHDGGRSSDTYAVSVHDGEERSLVGSAIQSRVATIEMSGDLADEAGGGISVFGGGGDTEVKGLHNQLQQALDDPLTRGVLLELRGIENMAQIEELRPRITRLRALGKPVVAYLEEGATRGDLYLASACDRIVTSEEASFGALGLRAERHYYRKVLADWGVRFDRTSYGKYKSAFRNYSVDSTSAADRESIERTLDVSQNLFVSTVAAERHMSRDRLLTILDGRMWPAREVVKAGLVDTVGYREDALALLGGLAGLGDNPREVDLSRTRPARREWTVPARIAVIYASGEIDLGDSGGDLMFGSTMGASTVMDQVDDAFQRRDVKAVVLRVESPGGSGLASNLIDHELELMKERHRKPLIVSMGEVAASGGYYIACHGDHIFADRYTYTGSIGVVSVKPSVQGWDKKHQVREDSFDRGRYMEGWSVHHDWDRELQASADSSSYDFYRGFVSKVAEGRHLSWQHVDNVGQGRVWMGEDARARKLVDEIGTLEDAIAEARRRGKVPEGQRIRLAEYRRPRPGILERLIGMRMEKAIERATRTPDPGEVLYWTDVDLLP